jgi:hypothetical protein
MTTATNHPALRDQPDVSLVIKEWSTGVLLLLAVHGHLS